MLPRSWHVVFVGARMKYAYKNKVYVILLSAFLAYPIDRSVHHWLLSDLSFGGIVWGFFVGFIEGFLAPHCIFLQWFQECLWPQFPVGHRNTAEAWDSLTKSKGGEWRGRSVLVNSQEPPAWWPKQLLESEWIAEDGKPGGWFWTVKLWRDLEEGEAWQGQLEWGMMVEPTCQVFGSDVILPVASSVASPRFLDQHIFGLDMSLATHCPQLMLQCLRSHQSVFLHWILVHRD